MKALRSIQWRMYLAALLGCILVGGFVVSLSLSYLQKEQQAELEKYYIERVDSVAKRTEATLSELVAVAIQLRSNPDLQRMFVTANSHPYQQQNYFLNNLEDRKSAQGIIWMFAAARPQIAGIHIFNESSYVGMRENLPDHKIQELAARELFQIPEGEDHIFLGLHRDEWDVLQQRDVFSVIHVFEATDYNFLPVGWIEVQAKYSLLEELCAVDPGSTEQVLILSESGQVICATQDITEQDIGDVLDLELAQGELKTVAFQGKECVITGHPLTNTDWMVFVVDDAGNIIPQLRSVLPMTFVSAIPIFVLILLCVTFAVRQVVKPILHLTREVEQITPENLNVSFAPAHLRELDTLQQAFTRLLECTDDANQKLLLTQQTELNLRIEALQSQINPHYLFNSLSTISAVGTEENSKRVPMMCYQLGELFRYVSQEETTQTTLADELGHITRYLDFMKWRYEDNLETKITIDGDLSQIPIAKLSLQPLVENCFAHGFKGTFPPYALHIDCRCSQAGWHFLISDNGIGFSQETIDRISQEIFAVDRVLRTHKGYEKLKSQNMAILNLYIRLKTQYGEKLWFEIIRDEELGGALVKIVVEYARKERMEC